MANHLDYVKWRGDIDFRTVPFNEMDCITLCQIAYLDFSSIICGDFRRRAMTLGEAGKIFFGSTDYKVRSDPGVMINSGTAELFRACCESPRFSSLRVCGFVNKIDLKLEEQFAAVTFSSDLGFNVVIFRGTDDTIVGWKEDFNLGYRDTVPAQKDALRYLWQAASSLRGRFYVGGHSKGGNLAVYASTYAADKVKKRIDAVYNNDGPGFHKDFFDSPEYRSVENRIRTFLPEQSIVGMLFCHGKNYSVVKSDQWGIMQHDPFSWQLCRGGFETAEELSEASIYISTTVNSWMEGLSLKEREEFIETVFKVLSDSRALTNTEFSENKLRSVGNMIRSMNSIDPKTKIATLRTFNFLFKCAPRKENFVVRKFNELASEFSKSGKHLESLPGDGEKN